jgi:hypothetical protein
MPKPRSGWMHSIKSHIETTAFAELRDRLQSGNQSGTLNGWWALANLVRGAEPIDTQILDMATRVD